MALNEIVVDRSPEVVWEVLADAYAYPDWVAGAKRIRDADRGFPQAGTRMYHTVGVGPLTLSDATEVIRSEPARLLILDARLGPLGDARVEIELTAHEGGTRVVLRETATRGVNKVVQPVGDVLLRGRNAWSLEQLKALAEKRA